MGAIHLLAGLLLGAGAQGGDDLNVLGTHFFVEDLRDRSIRESTRVPLRPITTCYRWRIDVPPEDRTIAVREVFRLPQAAPEWGIQQSPEREFTAVSQDRVSAVTEFQAPLAQGSFGHGWCVAQGDPAGTHVMRIYVGERLVHSFEFQVEPDTS